MKMKKIGPGWARPKFYYVDPPLYVDISSGDQDGVQNMGLTLPRWSVPNEMVPTSGGST